MSGRVSSSLCGWTKPSWRRRYFATSGGPSPAGRRWTKFSEGTGLRGGPHVSARALPGCLQLGLKPRQLRGERIGDDRLFRGEFGGPANSVPSGRQLVVVVGDGLCHDGLARGLAETRDTAAVRRQTALVMPRSLAATLIADLYNRTETTVHPSGASM
jgi:hypothetical protein